MEQSKLSSLTESSFSFNNYFNSVNAGKLRNALALVYYIVIEENTENTINRILINVIEFSTNPSLVKKELNWFIIYSMQMFIIITEIDYNILK